MNHPPDSIQELDDYAFELPARQIAQEPSPEREEARLLRLDRRSGERLGENHRVADLARLLRPGDLLVVNASRVVPARLYGHKATGGRAEALLLDVPADTGERSYRALVRCGGRLRCGLEFRFESGDAGLEAQISAIHPGGEVTLVFAPGPDPLSLGDAPLPPYIRRDPTAAAHAQARSLDLERYQTVYAREPGSVAAPTAGLHLTSRLLHEISSIGIRYCEVILHVGPGTFRPLGPGELAAGRLHEEFYELPESTAEAIRETRLAGGRVVAVGTTTTRVLETCASGSGLVRAGRGTTDLFLRPGDRFEVVDGMLTNFHLPRSSLLLLVAAFAGRKPILDAYQYAIDNDYRFYSYGDAMLIL